MPIDINARPLRILELDTGTGILSIVAAKILQPGTEIIVTGYHPEVLDNLTRNVTTNFPKHPAAMMCSVWIGEVPQYRDPLDRLFDLILAADVIY